MDTEDQMIRTLLAEPLPTVHAVAAARRRLTDEITATTGAAGGAGAAGAARAAGGLGRVGRRRAVRWRLSLGGAGLTAVAAAGLALVMTVGPGATGARPGPDLRDPGGTQAGPTGPAADASPAELLLAAANNADRATGTGRYWRFLTVTESGPLLVRTGPEPYRITQREASETWTARDPGGRSWHGEQQLGARPRADADRAAWERAGSPRTFDLGPADSPDGGRSTRSVDPQQGKLILSDTDPAYASSLGPLALADLPTDPQALRAAVLALIDKERSGDGARSQADRDWLTFQVLSGLLAEAPARAALRSAAFTVLSGLAGVVNAGPTRDAADRPGIALDLTEERGGYLSRARLILDPGTYQLLGIATVSGPKGSDGDVDTSPGQVFKESSTVVLRAEWTDQEPAPPALS